MSRVPPRPPIRSACAGLLAVALASLLSACAAGPARDAASADAALRRAEALLAEGDVAGAADAYLEAAASSEDPRLLGRAAAVAAAAERGADARPLVERWVALAPDDASAHARRAVLAFEGRELELALAAMARVRELAGAPAAAGLLVEGEPAARAQRVLARHAAAFPDDPAAHHALATAAWRAADLATAAAAVARARALDPGSIDAVVLEARIAVRRERGPAGLAALAELDRRAALPDARPALRLLAAMLRAEAGDAAAARATLAREVARAPESAEARLAFATVAAGMGDRDAAAEVLRPAAPEPARDDVRYELGRLAEQQGARSDALLWYREVRGDEYGGVAAAGIARVLAATDGMAEARAFLRAAREGLPAWATRLHAIEAQLLRDAGDGVGARRLLDEAIRETPDRDLRYLRAIIAADLGDHAAAARELRALLARVPDDPTLQNSLGYTLADAGRELDEAERLLAAALAAAPDSGAIVDSWGWLKYRRGDLAEARRHLERAYALNDDAEVAAHLGEVMWMQGERDAARTLWDAAAAREPAHRVLLATRARLER